MSDEAIRAAIEEVNKRRCECVYCSFCGGNGTYRVDFNGNPTDAIDDLYDLEYCDECHGGIVETCDRCREIEELYEQLEPL